MMADNQVLWIAEYWQSYEGGGVIGIYDSKELAANACQRKDGSDSEPLEFAPFLEHDEKDIFTVHGMWWNYTVRKIKINEDLE